MVVVDTELPAGEAIHIAIVDRARGRLRAMYLFDGLVAEGGTFDRYLLTCAAPPDAEPFWEAIAESAEVFEAITAEDEEAEPEE